MPARLTLFAAAVAMALAVALGAFGAGWLALAKAALDVNGRHTGE